MELGREIILSNQLISIITATIQDNKKLAKYLVNNVANPLTCESYVDEKDFKPESLILKKIRPYPFDDTSTTKEGTELRIFMHSGELQTEAVVRNSLIIFDVIVAKSLWLTNDGKPSLRPYDMVDCILNHLKDKRISGVGKLHFTEFAHLMINEKFSGVRLFAEVTDFNK